MKKKTNLLNDLLKGKMREIKREIPSIDDVKLRIMREHLICPRKQHFVLEKSATNFNTIYYNKKNT